MLCGVSLPPFERFGDARKLAELARQAEEAGWDGFFIWDHILFDDLWHPIVDPWVALAAIALNTNHIRMGTIVTPLARRRPWKLARVAPVRVLSPLTALQERLQSTSPLVRQRAGDGPDHEW